MADAYPRLQRSGIGLVAVTTDSERQQAEYVEALKLPYLLYCDERRTAVELLGIGHRQVEQQRRQRAMLSSGLSRLDVVPRAEPRGLVARLLEAINPPT